MAASPLWNILPRAKPLWNSSSRWFAASAIGKIRNHNRQMNCRRAVESASPRESALTTREREVLKLLAEGKTVRGAATDLGLSSKTVDAHKFNLMRKLGIHNKAELVMWAIQKRVVKIPA